MKEKIQKFIEIFPTVTKEESDAIANILRWDEETKMAFFIAKEIFEESDEKP